jgi:hypothetical protein
LCCCLLPPLRRIQQVFALYDVKAEFSLGLLAVPQGNERTFSDALPALQFPALLVRLGRIADDQQRRLGASGAVVAQLLQAAREPLLQSWRSVVCAPLRAELQEMLRDRSLEVSRLTAS